MPTYGKTEEFKGDNWDEYVERLDCFFEANEIKDAAKKRQILLATVGAETYHLIKTLFCP